MARIVGVDLPNNKRLDIALTYIYGIGRVNVARIIRESQIEPNRRTQTLTDEEASRLAKIIDKNFKVEGDLRQEVHGKIKRLKEIGCFRGSRHAHALPSRGQRTKSNARTRRGRRQTIGAMKKDDRAKLDTKAKAPAATAAKK